MSGFTNRVFDEFLDGEHSIYARLLTDIARGVFVSGDRLVTTQLAERYGTSINPIREALKQLEGEGFVTSQRNSGARVTQFEYATMRDVFELLKLLEPYLLEWFIAEHSEAQLDVLEQILVEMKKAELSDYPAFKELDMAFHWEMYRHHYNKSAVSLWKSKKLVLAALHANLPISRSRFDSVIVEHQEIVNQLKKGAISDAHEALMKHIDNAGDYWSRTVR